MGSKRPGELGWIKTHGTENIAGLQFWEKICLTTVCLNTDGKEPDSTLSITT